MQAFLCSFCEGGKSYSAWECAHAPRSHGWAAKTAAGVRVGRQVVLMSAQWGDGACATGQLSGRLPALMGAEGCETGSALAVTAHLRGVWGGSTVVWDG